MVYGRDDIIAFEENEEETCDEEEWYEAEETRYLEEAWGMVFDESYHDCTSDERATAHENEGSPGVGEKCPI